MKLRLAAATVVVLAGAAMVTSGPARAVSGVASGYWWAAQGDSGVLTAPPTVPQGGLWVSSNASGPQAVSAVRFDLASGESAPVNLTLKVASNQLPSQVGLAAYATTTNWSPTQAGPWSQRPTYDPSTTAVQGLFSSDGTSVTFDLTPLTTGPTVNVVIAPVGAPVSTSGTPVPAPPALPITTTTVAVPTTLPGGVAVPTTVTTPVTTPVPQPAPAPGGPTFDITFNPVTAGSVSVAALPPPVTSPPVTEAPAPAPAPLAPVVPSDAPAFTVSPVTQAPAVTPVTAAPRRRVVRLTRPVPAAAHLFGRSWRDRLILGFLLFDVALYLFWDSEREAGHRLPKLTLYDDPGIRRAVVVARRRPGLPPPIR